MSLQAVANNFGIIVSSVLPFHFNNRSTSTLDAAGESSTAIGQCYLQAGSGSKTISSSGGKIYWMTSLITFADAGTNLRIGIQDVGATGLEDGTFDVYADLVGGTDTINANTIMVTTMETGSKTISHGDVIAVSIETTARGGADSIQVARQSSSGGQFAQTNFPYYSFDTGSGPAKSGTAFPAILIEFDDGTIGWLNQAYLGHPSTTPSTFTYASNSATDEYAAVFKLPFEASIRGASVMVGSLASTDDFEVILYSDPFGTPVAEQTVVVEPNLTGSLTVTSSYWVNFAPEELSADTFYAIAVRPTTTGSITLGYFDLGSGNEKMKRPSPFAGNIQLAGRADQTGAFVETDADHLPIVWLAIDKFDDGAGGAGGPAHIIGG